MENENAMTDTNVVAQDANVIDAPIYLVKGETVLYVGRANVSTTIVTGLVIAVLSIGMFSSFPSVLAGILIGIVIGVIARLYARDIITSKRVVLRRAFNSLEIPLSKIESVQSGLFNPSVKGVGGSKIMIKGLARPKEFFSILSNALVG
jgi:hypothetical protein